MILVLVLVLVLVFGVFGEKLGLIKNDYSIVYLSTGEVYIGKLTTFPSLQLTDVYIYQATKDATDESKTNFQLQPIKDTLWAPKVLHLVRENVVFYGPLMPTSKIVETITAQTK